MTTDGPLQLDEAIAHLSKRSLASALKVSSRTLDRDLSRLQNLIKDDAEIDHEPNDRGYSVSTAKYLILFRALVKKGMSRNRAATTLSDNSFRGIDYLIEQQITDRLSQTIDQLINQIISGEHDGHSSPSSTERTVSTASRTIKD